MYWEDGTSSMDHVLPALRVVIVRMGGGRGPLRRAAVKVGCEGARGAHHIPCQMKISSLFHHLIPVNLSGFCVF